MHKILVVIGILGCLTVNAQKKNTDQKRIKYKVGFGLANFENRGVSFVNELSIPVLNFMDIAPSFTYVSSFPFKNEKTTFVISESRTDFETNKDSKRSNYYSLGSFDVNLLLKPFYFSRKEDAKHIQSTQGNQSPRLPNVLDTYICEDIEPLKKVAGPL